MIKDITIGQFYPTDSVLHKLDPRTKLAATFLYIIFLFVINNLWGYIAAFAFLTIMVVISKIPISYILRGLKALIFIIVFTVVVNMFWTPGKVLWRWGFLKLTVEGIVQAVRMAVRLILLVSSTSLMTLCTSTIALTDGMEHAMKKIPLVKKVAHEISMMMSIALRFIPTLTDETDKIMKAQKSRGADFESGNIFRRAKTLIPVLVPLFVSAFQRANELAMAMESRCYQGGINRTRMKELRYARRDIIAYVITFFVMGLLLVTRFIPVWSVH